MSGGFFRGTSADQDTRFSNKQAKLLKSQKFAPELDHPVDMTKVKMDVIRPWIAARATELLGFEDEVLINFVYGLLDGKNVDGKKIQIQLTGFMEKNTGKFMKELWSLLLSAQKNISGVPQQFLDAKEEEQRKKKEENDRIAQEIQKKKEKTNRELERERKLRTDSDDGMTKSIYSDADPLTKPRASSDQPVEGSEKGGRYARKSRNEHSSSEDRSNGRKGHKSRSLSAASHSQRYSDSPIRRHLSPTRRSLTPRRRKSPHARRRRSTSRLRHKSPSPYWRRSSHSRRSPFLPRRSPSPRHRRSRSPVRCRSPVPRRRLPSPLHRGSSPLRRRSPIRRRSPSPLHRRSSPIQHRSPLSMRRRSTSPRRSPVRHWSPSRSRHESTSPTTRRSPKREPLNQRKRSSLPSPVSPAGDQISLRPENRNHSPPRYRIPSDFRSSSRELENLVDKPRSSRSERMHEKVLTACTDTVRGLAKYDLSEKSPVNSVFRTGQRTSPIVNSQSPRSSYSPQKHRSNHRSRHDSPESSNEDDRNPPKRNLSSNAKAMISNIKHYVDRSEMDERKVSRPASHSSEEIEYGPGGAREERNLFVTDEDGEHSTKKAGHDYLGDRECKEMMRKSSDGHNKTNAVRGRSKDVEYREIIRGEGEHGKRSQSSCSDSEEFENIVKRRHKRSEKSEKDVKVSSDTDSQVEGRKEAKRRRKEEKRMRREERRRRREERHRKRLERHAAKHKGKATDNASPLSGFEKQNVEVGNSEGNADDARRSSHSKDVEDGVSEQKRLEIELRNKALESLRAKKAIG